MLSVHNKNLYITDTILWVFLFLVSGFAMLWIEAQHVLCDCDTDRIVTGREQEVLERVSVREHVACYCLGVAGATWVGGVALLC